MKLCHALVAFLLCAGCVGRVADHCPNCVVIREGKPAAISVGEARALVVLVHGAYGFGDEWKPIVDALRGAPEIAFFAFEWRGPFHPLDAAAGELQASIQGALDHFPSLTEVLVLAHSAGGPLGTRAVLGLRVPAGKRVRVAEIDSPDFIDGRPFFRNKIKEMPPIPPGVARLVFRARDLGPKVSHDRAVAVAGLPLLVELRQKLNPMPAVPVSPPPTPDGTREKVGSTGELLRP
jgi:hypothetical protein